MASGLAVFYLGWAPATELMYSGDGEYEVHGNPILQTHSLTFGQIDIAESGVHRYAIRGFAPYEGPYLILHIKDLPTSVAQDSEVCFRATLFRSDEETALFTREECLREAVFGYTDDYIDKYGVRVRLGERDLDISRFRKYELVIEVVGEDVRLASTQANLRYMSGWK